MLKVQMRSRTASYMDIYLDVFSMDSVYVTDRLAIVLNIMNSGLLCQRRSREDQG